MPNINFDETQRRDAKEPQITKNQLLEQPHHSDFGVGWETPRSIYGTNDFLTNDSSWGFDALNTSEMASNSPKAPVKQEPTTPAPDLEQQGRQSDHDEGIQNAANEKSEDYHNTADRRGSGTSSDDKYGRKTGVIDLTGDDSDDDEQDGPMPERQFVPRAEHDNSAPLSKRHKSPSPRRTFTKGLAPIAAHPRKPAIVHRSKPPIKPASRRPKPVSSSPSPAVTPSQNVFSQRRRRLTSQPIEFPLADSLTRSSTVRTLECSPLGDTPDSMDQTPDHESDHVQVTTPTSQEIISAPSVPQKALGPFLQDEDSSDEDVEEANNKTKKSTTREKSVARIIKRPRNDTPTRIRHDAMQEESRVMREKARERAHEDIATRANTMALDADDTAFDMFEEQAFLGHPHPR